MPIDTDDTGYGYSFKTSTNISKLLEPSPFISGYDRSDLIEAQKRVVDSHNAVIYYETEALVESSEIAVSIHDYDVVQPDLCKFPNMGHAKLSKSSALARLEATVNSLLEKRKRRQYDDNELSQVASASLEPSSDTPVVKEACKRARLTDQVSSVLSSDTPV